MSDGPSRRLDHVGLNVAGLASAESWYCECHWTLMDNFEWIFGYGHQLGLYSVDRDTFVRTPKDSATVYANIVRADGTKPTG